MPITFGSVGDIISVCQVVNELLQALNDCRGSSSEYQGLMRELWSFERALLEVEQLASHCGKLAEINALQQTAKQIATQCRSSIDDFLRKIRRYRSSLREGGSGSSVRDAFWKIHWRTSHKDDLQKFRTIINGHLSSIDILLLTSGMYVRPSAFCSLKLTICSNMTRSQDKSLHARLDEAESKSEEAARQERGMLIEIKKGVQKVNTILADPDSWSSKLFESFGL